MINIIIKRDVFDDGIAKIYDAFQILKAVFALGNELTKINHKIRDFDEEGYIRTYDAFRFLRQAIMS